MSDLGAVDTTAGRALYFLALTATRTDETREARWREINLAERGVDDPGRPHENG
jgi:hypothetical protein